jgi:hypothetical protein
VREGAAEGVMVKKAAVLVGVLFLFSCGELPEKRPEDWDSRTDFSDKRYRGGLFDNWYDVRWEKTIQADGDAIGIDKSPRWKASGMASSVGKPIYFVLRAENLMMVTFGMARIMILI